MPQTNDVTAVQSEPVKSNHVESATHGHGHGQHTGDHHHAFANPEELARKWNDPKRDEWQHPEQIIDALALEPGETVADLGAGTGYLVAHLSNAVGKDGTVIAIDAEPAMIEYLANHKSQLGPATVVPQKVGSKRPSADRCTTRTMARAL